MSIGMQEWKYELHEGVGVKTNMKTKERAERQTNVGTVRYGLFVVISCFSEANGKLGCACGCNDLALRTWLNNKPARYLVNTLLSCKYIFSPLKGISTIEN